MHPQYSHTHIHTTHTYTLSFLTWREHQGVPRRVCGHTHTQTYTHTHTPHTYAHTASLPGVNTEGFPGECAGTFSHTHTHHKHTHTSSSPGVNSEGFPGERVGISTPSVFASCSNRDSVSSGGGLGVVSDKCEQAPHASRQFSCAYVRYVYSARTIYKCCHSHVATMLL
jgi:hypothetical protein